MKYTAIIHYKNGNNVQSNFSKIKNFERDMIFWKDIIVWAKLFDVETGDEVSGRVNKEALERRGCSKKQDNGNSGGRNENLYRM